jgi:hypothetical protein
MARFSDRPDVAKPGLEPRDYGNEFASAARAMIGNLLAIPLPETVMGFVLLAHHASESTWPHRSKLASCLDTVPLHPKPLPSTHHPSLITHGPFHPD